MREISFEIIEDGGVDGDGSYFCSVSCWESYVDSFNVQDEKRLDIAVTDEDTLKILDKEDYECDYCKEKLFIESDTDESTSKF